MKTKIILLLSAVALLTLSFTFVSVKTADKKELQNNITSSATSAPIGGLYVDEVVE
jgi:cell division protein FtsL